MRKSKDQKLETIEKQIKKLQEQKKTIENNMRLNIGKTLLEEWEIEDEELAISIIKSLKGEALKLVKDEANNYSSGEEIGRDQ
jgi:conjugal transfer/entry exclusion protein